MASSIDPRQSGWLGPAAARDAWQQEHVRTNYVVYPRGCVRDYGRYAPWDRAMGIALGRTEDGGHIWPKFYAQVDGDCVGRAMGNCLQWHSMNRMAMGEPIRFAYAYTPYAYAVGRCSDAGGNGQLGSGRNAGSMGVWQCAATHAYGQLFYADDDTLDYTRAESQRWGGAQTTPWKKWLPIAKDNVIAKPARIQTVDEAKDVLCSGAVLHISSSVGYSMRAVRRAGKWWYTGRDTWYHSTALIAYAPAGDTGNHPACFFQDNSWGPDAHGITEILDGPPTGAWIEDDRLDSILRSSGCECIAVGGWIGYPANELDLLTI